MEIDECAMSARNNSRICSNDYMYKVRSECKRAEFADMTNN